MSFEIGLLLVLIAVSLAAFAFDWLPADVVGLGLMLTLVLTGILSVEKAFAGFSSDTVLLILGLLILTAALLKTGIMDVVGRAVLRHTGDQPRRVLLVVMIAATTLSAFISNTACTALFIPIVIGVAQRSKVSSSTLLLPAFSSILSSSTTLISTSSNLVISGLMSHAGMEPMRLFELTPVGIPIVVVGLAYMYFVGSRLMPHRAVSPELIESFGMRPYLTEIVILPDSPLIGKSLEEARLGRELDLTALQIVREKAHFFPTNDLKLRARDVVLVEGAREDVLKIKDIRGIEIKADVHLSDPSLESQDLALVEAILLPRSPLIGRTLKQSRFRQRYGLQVLALNRHGQNVLRKLSQVPLRMGDVLLIQGHKAQVGALNEEGTFRILGVVQESRFQRGKAILAGAAFIGAIVLSVAHIVPLPVAMLLGAFTVFATRCISPEDAYREVEWRAIILIACMLSLGAAMESTGAARYLAGLLVQGFGGLGPIGMLVAFFGLTVALTQPMSNQAAAAVVLPIAIETGSQMALNPRTFAMMIAVAASCSYLTPLEPSCLMVYGPGRYRFFDFFKVGFLLTLLILVIAIVLVPVVWPLAGTG